MRLLSFVIASLVAAAAAAQPFPSKPIIIVVPFAPGGPAEGIARITAQSMEQVLKEKIVSETEPGAGGNIGAQYVAKQSRPDGYTMLFGSTTLASSVSLMKTAYDARKDLVPVAGIGMIPNLLITGPNSPYKTVKDVVDAAKAKPKTITFGSSGPGTGSHLAGELFKATSGIDLVHVPYKGISLAVPAVIAGEVQLTFAGIATSTGPLKSGRIKAIAIGGPKRSPLFPDVPTFTELGYPEVETHAWFGLFLPTGSPRDAVVKIHADVKRILEEPEFRQKQLIDRGYEVVGSSPEEFSVFLRKDFQSRGRAVKISGAKAE